MMRAWLCVAVWWVSAATALAAASGKFEPTAQDKIVPSDSKLEVLWAEGEFTEGPAPAADGAILFSDIGDRIMRYDPASGRTTVFRSPSGRSNGLKFDPKGRLVACEGANTGGNRRISITELDGTVRTLADSFNGKRFNSPNDLAITRGDRVYFTDPRYVGDEPRELDFEGVFLIDPDGTVRVAAHIQKPNGIIVAPDQKTVYVSDNNSLASGNHQLLSYRMQDDGKLVDKHVVFDFGPNRRGIDGMTIDLEGRIYATAGSGSKAGIYVFSPEGEALALIPTPGDPTNCVFGIGKEASTLYITAATKPAPAGTSQRPPYGLFRIRLASPGYHVFPVGK